jgi:hypothetical protein
MFGVESSVVESSNRRTANCLAKQSWSSVVALELKKRNYNSIYKAIISTTRRAFLDLIVHQDSPPRSLIQVVNTCGISNPRVCVRSLISLFCTINFSSRQQPFGLITLQRNAEAELTSILLLHQLILSIAMGVPALFRWLSQKVFNTFPLSRNVALTLLI